MSVPELRQVRVVRSTGRIAACSSSSPTPPRSTAARSRSAASRPPSLVAAHGSPLVVYDEATLRANARAYRAAAPDAFVAYGTKAFPNVALLAPPRRGGHRRRRLHARRAALRAARPGSPATALVVHGNNKSDDELRAAAEAGALVVIDSLEEIDRARAAGITRTLIRVTPGIEADTHEHIRTGHHGSKFGLPPDDALEALRRAPETRGTPRARRLAAARHRRGADGRRLARDASRPAPAPRPAGSRARSISAAGSASRPRPTTRELGIEPFVRALLAELERALDLHGLPRPQVILEPGRSLVARAGVTLYTVGSVKRASASTTYVAVDGGISDNPRPALYGARYTALLANRAGRGAGRHLRRRRQALRVGRPADRARRASRAAPRRHPRRPRDRRLHARDELELQRRPSPGGRPRRATARHV